MRLLALALLIATPAASQNAAIGVNAAIRNQVSMKTAADAAARPARLRESVHLGDAIASGPASALQVLLRDRSVFTVGSNARMTIDRFVYDPARGSGEVAASVAKGAFRFMSGRALGSGGSAAVRTPVASIGVRGTIVEGIVGEDAIAAAAGEPGVSPGGDPETATLIVLRGPGARTDGLDKRGGIDVTAGGVTVAVDRPGFAVFVAGPNQPPVGPFALSNAAFERISALLRGAPENGARDDGPVEVAAAAVESGEILRDTLFAGSVIDDPVFTDFPVVASDQLGVPCTPTSGGGGGGGGDGGGGKFCPF